MAGLTAEEQHIHNAQRDPRGRGRWLSDVVLGAQDGLSTPSGEKVDVEFAHLPRCGEGVVDIGDGPSISLHDLLAVHGVLLRATDAMSLPAARQAARAIG